ncbi:AraC family transcriptional regulator [Clostridium psychrophilum]|uniref:AraC family transcriptional regulator n=1 Tax=Clostridium psychrophilum TaxID=132926 RepID=UPI001C0AD190|nr:AraC family transcriptional regulator [Clostridium psychrophilum]MBU3182841.1 AraC family transcriptional regulator [Clostridium psychrophilum]
MEVWCVENANFTNTDLNFYDCGEEVCAKGYFFGPVARNHYIIHFILSGKGTFICGKKLYKLEAGDAFLICPDHIAYYEADMKEPWHYLWVGFNGVKVPKIIHRAGLSYDNPIFYYDTDNFFKDMIQKMASFTKLSLETDLSRLAYLYPFLAKLIEIGPKPNTVNLYESNIERYVINAVDYIEVNFYSNISVNSLAEHIGISRKYLCTIFKTALGQTPIEYIIKTRMENVCHFLTNHDLSIAEVSTSVGYSDQFVFSKQFKKTIGQCPSYYRNNHK